MSARTRDLIELIPCCSQNDGRRKGMQETSRTARPKNSEPRRPDFELLAAVDSAVSASEDLYLRSLF